MRENITDTIDRYLSGEMDTNERKDFELEISTNKELSAEVKLQQKIIEGVQRQALRNLLKTEAQKRAKRAQKQLLRRFVISTVSVAASIALVLFVHIDNRNECISLAVTPSIENTRGIVDLSQIIELIDGQNFDAASKKITQARAALPTTFPEGEEGEYQQQISKFISDNLDWYNLTIIMKQGKWYKSKKLLQEIANSNSIFAPKAKVLLEKM